MSEGKSRQIKAVRFRMMDQFYNSILSSQEREDNRLCASDESMLRAVEKEFSNAQSLIRKAQTSGFTLAAFFSGEEIPTDFPMPVRKTDSFYVKKHTMAMRPYWHRHEFYELIAVQSGSCRQTMGDGSNVVLQKGQCCLICPDMPHRLEEAGKHDVILKMVIPQAFFLAACKEIAIPETGYTVFVPMSLPAQAQLIRLLQESAAPKPYSRPAIRSNLTLLLCELARSQLHQQTNADYFYCEYFQKKLKTASLQDFARAYGYCAAYASRLVRQKTGKSFTQLLTQYRMQRAAELLRDSELCVEDIARTVGYQTPAGLYKQFGACFGMTPTEYRRTLRDG